MNKSLASLTFLGGLCEKQKKFDMENPATADDWKITYICKKSAA